MQATRIALMHQIKTNFIKHVKYKQSNFQPSNLKN